MGRRVGFWAIVYLAWACGTSPPEDITYPPLPSRHASEAAGDAGRDARSAQLKAVEAEAGSSTVEEGEEAADTSPIATPIDAGADVDANEPPDAGVADAAMMDAGACALEIEPNDAFPNLLSYGNTCGALASKDVDRFVFRPAKATKISVTATDFAVFYVGEFGAAQPFELLPGQSITVPGGAVDWHVIVAGARPLTYGIRVDEVP